MDIRIIEPLSEEYRQSLELRDNILRKPLGLSLFNENLDNEVNYIHIGVFLDCQIIGILILTPLSPDTVKMRQVAVREDFQGKGIGTRMVRFAEEIAKKQGFKRIVLNARKTAVPFYRKLFYDILSDEFTEVGIPHYKMSKNLSQSI
jgi:predicted GNAT family N-acyltransferase